MNDLKNIINESETPKKVQIGRINRSQSVTDTKRPIRESKRIFSSILVRTDLKNRYEQEKQNKAISKNFLQHKS